MKQSTKEKIIMILSVIITLVLVFGFIMCLGFSPWVMAYEGKCLTGLCPKWMGCLK